MHTKLPTVSGASISLEDKLGDFYHQESSFKGCHRQCCDRYRTSCSFYMVYFSGLKYPLIKTLWKVSCATFIEMFSH